MERDPRQSISPSARCDSTESTYISDYLDGSFASSVSPEIRQSLSHLIVPSNLSMPILPNFFFGGQRLGRICSSRETTGSSHWLPGGEGDAHAELMEKQRTP